MPGPPGELRVRGRAGSTSVTLEWRQLARNPATVTLYRVFLRPQAADGYNRTDTADTMVTLHLLPTGCEGGQQRGHFPVH